MIYAITVNFVLQKNERDIKSLFFISSSSITKQSIAALACCGYKGLNIHFISLYYVDANITYNT